MFTKNYMIMLLLFGSFATIMAQIAVFENEEIINIAQPYQCYCSERCGPRKVTAEDSPSIDKTTGKCFCQQWDKDNYELNKCNLLSEQEIENSYCKALAR